MKKIIWIICLLIMPSMTGAEHLILKDGLYIRDVKIIVNKKGIIQFRHGGSDKMWGLDSRRIQNVSDSMPAKGREIQPVERKEYFTEIKKTGEKQREAERTVSLNNLSEACRLYSANRKEPMLAMSCAALLPSSGHAYAGDWGRGFFFMVPEILCLVVAFAPIEGIDPTLKSLSLFPAFLIVKGIEMYDAAMTTEDSNEQLRKKLKMDLGVDERGIRLDLKF
ncbi:hypothetical protein K8S19_04355 [bacterium]|nr:hypothetical protein [bacterium]